MASVPTREDVEQAYADEHAAMEKIRALTREAREATDPEARRRAGGRAVSLERELRKLNERCRDLHQEFSRAGGMLSAPPTPREVGLEDRRWDCRNDDTE